MPLTDALADQIASKVSKEIVTSTVPAANRPPSLGAAEQGKIEKNWEEIIKLIVKEVFTQIKDQAVIKIDSFSITGVPSEKATLATAPGGGPVAGTISPPTNPITGKIT